MPWSAQPSKIGSVAPASAVSGKAASSSRQMMTASSPRLTRCWFLESTARPSPRAREPFRGIARATVTNVPWSAFMIHPLRIAGGFPAPGNHVRAQRGMIPACPRVAGCASRLPAHTRDEGGRTAVSRQPDRLGVEHRRPMALPSPSFDGFALSKQLCWHRFAEMTRELRCLPCPHLVLVSREATADSDGGRVEARPPSLISRGCATASENVERAAVDGRLPRRGLARPPAQEPTV